MYDDDDVPSEDPLKIFEAEVSEEHTGIPLSEPSNTSSSSSISRPEAARVPQKTSALQLNKIYVYN